MEVDAGDVKIEEVPVVVPKFNHAVASESTVDFGNVVNQSIKKTNSTKKVGKDSPRKVTLTKGKRRENVCLSLWISEPKVKC